VAECRSCGAPIRWVTTINDKRIPIDREPDPDGNIYASLVDGEWRAVVRGPEADPPAGRHLYRAHFATCPDAKSWRVNQ